MPKFKISFIQSVPGEVVVEAARAAQAIELVKEMSQQTGFEEGAHRLVEAGTEGAGNWYIHESSVTLDEVLDDDDDTKPDFDYAEEKYER